MSTNRPSYHRTIPCPSGAGVRYLEGGRRQVTVDRCGEVTVLPVGATWHDFFLGFEALVNFLSGQTGLRDRRVPRTIARNPFDGLP